MTPRDIKPHALLGCDMAFPSLISLRSPPSDLGDMQVCVHQGKGVNGTCPSLTTNKEVPHGNFDSQGGTLVPSGSEICHTRQVGP
jgi:hypothetical protein